MTYLPTLHAYLHNSSLLIQAYPTTRITTKYSLPRKPKATKPSKPSSTSTPNSTSQPSKEKPQPTATLTLKTFHPESGICLKYRTDKAAEVGRLMAGLGRLAKGEIIEMPTAAEGGGAVAATAGADEEAVVKAEEKVEPARTSTPVQTQQQQQQQGGGGKGKKKKGGKK